MFNSPLDAYGGIKMPAPIPNAARITGTATLRPVDTAQNRQSTEVDKTALTNAVKKLNELVAPSLQSIQFSMDEEAGRMVVKVVDTTTQKTVRQIPNEEVLAFSKTLGRLQGLVVREQA